MDWPLIATVATPFLVLIAKILLERRPNVLAYYSNIASFQLAGEPPGTIHSHTVVLRNSGREPATGIRLTHPVFIEPVQVNVQPDVEHKINREDRTITIPRLRPKEQVQVAYMYPSDFRFDQISGQISHDEGFVKHINVIPQRQFPRWRNALAGVLLLIGLMVAVNVIANIVSWLWQIRSAWLPVLAGG